MAIFFCQVFRGLITKNNQEKNLIHKGLIINPLYKLLVFSCKKYVIYAFCSKT